MHSLNLTEPDLVTARDKLSWVFSKNPDIAMLSKIKFHDQTKLNDLMTHIRGARNGPYSLHINS